MRKRSLNELVRGIVCATVVCSLTTIAFHAIDLTIGNEAHAAGGGGGGGGGEGGGDRADGRGHGADNGRGVGRGAGRDRDDGPGNGKGRGRGNTASELGGMNAAHASERARERAAPNSKVGQLGAYRDDMQTELDLGASLAEAHEAVAQDFEDALNGIADLSEEAVNELADLLGLEERD